MEYTIRRGTPEDGPGVLEVFNIHAASSTAAFTPGPLPEGAFAKWLEMAREHIAYVVEVDGVIVGFAMLKRVIGTATFNRAAEVGYFLHPEHTGKGLGSQLLARLEDEARNLGVKTLLADISSDNTGSIAFHEQHGFVECGRWKQVGEKLGRVFDVVWMQKESL
jgi:phosphinothricin acetyltransferase